MKMPDLTMFEEYIEDLVDNSAGDAYEGWNDYWIDNRRNERIEKIKAELRAWQAEAEALATDKAHGGLR